MQEKLLPAKSIVGKTTRKSIQWRERKSLREREEGSIWLETDRLGGRSAGINRLLAHERLRGLHVLFPHAGVQDNGESENQLTWSAITEMLVVLSRRLIAMSLWPDCTVVVASTLLEREIGHNIR